MDLSVDVKCLLNSITNNSSWLASSHVGAHDVSKSQLINHWRCQCSLGWHCSAIILLLYLRIGAALPYKLTVHGSSQCFSGRMPNISEVMWMDSSLWGYVPQYPVVSAYVSITIWQFDKHSWASLPLSATSIITVYIHLCIACQLYATTRAV